MNGWQAWCNFRVQGEVQDVLHGIAETRARAHPECLAHLGQVDLPCWPELLQEWLVEIPELIKCKWGLGEFALQANHQVRCGEQNIRLSEMVPGVIPEFNPPVVEQEHAFGKSLS
jgi:hypothetical protein